jgi:O-antigen/teichoic acid export membrane protein
VLATGLLALFTCVRLVPGIRLSYRLTNFSLLRSLMPYSLQVFVIGIAALVILYVDNAIISLFMPVAAVTLYGAGFRVYQTLRELSGAIMNAVMPETARAEAHADRRRMADLLVRGTKFSNATVLLAGVPALVLAHPLLVAWLGPRFESVELVTQLLVVSLLINNNHVAAVGVLTGKGRIGRFTAYHVAWAAANVLLSVGLVQLIGLEGVALGTLLPLLVLEPLYVRTALREVGVPLGDFLRHGVGRPYLVAGLAAVPFLSLTLAWSPEGLLGIAAAGAAYAALYLLLFAFMGLDARERERFMKRPLRRMQAVVAQVVSP